MFFRGMFRSKISILLSISLFCLLTLILLFKFFPKAITTRHTPSFAVESKITNRTKEVKGTKTLPTKLIPSLTQSPTSSPGKIFIGMWSQGFYDVNTNSLHPEKLIEMENKVEKHMAIAHYYRGWHTLTSPEVIQELRSIDSNRWRPMISANPYFFERCNSNGLPLYRAIAQGNCDDFIRDIGRNLKEFARPLFLRFAWEMNLPNMEWGVTKTNSSPKDFIDAWRKIHDILYSENATNVLFVFSPNVETSQSISFNELYPGDAYVDWIGIDGYNWGTTQSWSSWQSFNEIFSLSYSKLSQIAPSKPIMIAEINTTDKGGNKAKWYTETLNKIPYSYPKIKAIVFYNEDRTTQENVNWLIDITKQTLNAFSNAVHSSLYLSLF